MRKYFDQVGVSKSSQQREIAPGQTLWIPVFKTDLSHVTIISNLEIESFSSQAEQDCNIVLDVGDNYLFKTGKYSDPKKTKGTFNARFVKEDRTQGSSNNYTGGLLTQSSSTVDSFPDNFFGLFKYRALGKENQDIYWKITNQSAVYRHVLIVKATGKKYRVTK